jgi:predicted metalloprotease with PDZ domain
VEFKFPGLWSKVTTGLNDISPKRDIFLYEAEDYDTLLDSPIEIGCHETDGFMAFEKEHHLAFYGETYPHPYNLKNDIKKIIEHVGAHFSDIPYDSYYVITHFAPNKFGGLEHKNSTALQFDGRRLAHRKDYIQWLALVAHEYFHTWNIKRIRPKELGPFDYVNENYTKMLWLAEGLTSFMDELFVYRSGLCTLEEYLSMQKDNFARYYKIAGRKFHSLEDSSFNAWIKLYRPDENSHNSSISYYLKGGMVFSILHIELLDKGKNINDLLTMLWDRYKENPEVGVTTDEVMRMIQELGGEETRNHFEQMISTTEEIDFEKYYKKIGIGFNWTQPTTPYMGANFKYDGDRVFVNSVDLDGPAHKYGLNAGDEIIAINRQRFLAKDAKEIAKYLSSDKSYLVTISRLDSIIEIEMTLSKAPKEIKAMEVKDRKLAEKALK